MICNVCSRSVCPFICILVSYLQDEDNRQQHNPPSSWTSPISKQKGKKYSSTKQSPTWLAQHKQHIHIFSDVKCLYLLSFYFCAIRLKTQIQGLIFRPGLVCSVCTNLTHEVRTKFLKRSFEKIEHCYIKLLKYMRTYIRHHIVLRQSSIFYHAFNTAITSD